MRKFFTILASMLSAWCFTAAGIFCAFWADMPQMSGLGISLMLFLIIMSIAVGLYFIWAIRYIWCAKKNIQRTQYDHIYERSSNDESN